MDKPHAAPHTPTAHPRAATARKRRVNATKPDAVALLKADHRAVKGLFNQFVAATTKEHKARLAQQICKSLQIHATIEEEIFYPAFLNATHDKKSHHTAEIEHGAARDLIAKIVDSSPEDDYFDAKIQVLAGMIRMHVNEEERRGGMFARARSANMDMKALGEQLQNRKSELLQGEDINMAELSASVVFI